MHKKLYNFLGDHNILFNNRFGFRKNKPQHHLMMEINENELVNYRTCIKYRKYNKLVVLSHKLTTEVTQPIQNIRLDKCNILLD